MKKTLLVFVNIALLLSACATPTLPPSNLPVPSTIKASTATSTPVFIPTATFTPTPTATPIPHPMSKQGVILALPIYP